MWDCHFLMEPKLLKKLKQGGNFWMGSLEISSPQPFQLTDKEDMDLEFEQSQLYNKISGLQTDKASAEFQHLL